MIKIKTIFQIGMSLLIANLGYSQPVSSVNIDSCYVWAKRNYPLSRRYELLEKSTAYSIENANKAYLPQFSIVGQATYQSEVTQIPIDLPNMSIEPLSNDQYRLYGEVNQPLTDLFLVNHNKGLVVTNAKAEIQKLEVELYQVKDRINNLYFGVLLLDAQIAQSEVIKKDLQNGLDRLSTAVANGLALPSDADNLKAELLKANQRVIELKSNRQAYIQMLVLFTGKAMDESTILEKPVAQITSLEIHRPELKLYDFQKSTFDYQAKLLKVKNLPRFSLFLQSGLGRPALNLLSNDFETYYLGGLKLNWNFTGLYTYKNDKKIIELNQKGIDLQRDVFLFNTNLTLKQQSTEMAKYRELIRSDNEILVLREGIKNTLQQQLAFGTVTSNDYLTAVNAQDQAQLSLILHQIQLLLAQYNYQTTAGN